MCVKFPLGDLNLNPYPPHPTSTYTYGVTIALMVSLKANQSIISWSHHKTGWAKIGYKSCNLTPLFFNSSIMP